MKYSSRFFLYAPLGLFLALAIGVGIQWWLAASSLSARLAAMNGHEVAPGVMLRFESRTISGFPFNLDTLFRGVALSIATPQGSTEWRSEELAMHALTYGRAETIFEAAGKQELRWTKADGRERVMPFAVGSLRASAIEDRTGPARFDLDLAGFGSRTFTARRLQFHIRHDGSDTFDLALMADDVRISPGRCFGLGSRLAAGRLTGTVTRAQSFSPWRTGAQDWGSAVVHWRAAGGSLQIDALRLDPAEGPHLRKALTQIPADRLFAVTDLLDALCDWPRY